MSSDTYEVEVKSLLGSPEKAGALIDGMKAMDPTCALLSSYTQLNHYFEGGDPLALANTVGPLLTEDERARMMRIATEGTNLSVRTREMNGESRMVIKASIGDDSSANGVARLEVEAVVPETPLSELDAMVLSAGYTYQAKWSRSREEYKVHDVTVCLDKNAGYGYLAEFEKVITNASEAESTKTELLTLMQQLGVEELPQDRLERMFKFYNANWSDYYGTDNIFTLE